MTIKYKNVPMVFDWAKFASDCVREIELIKGADPSLRDNEIAVIMLGVSEGYISALRQWAKGNTNEAQRGQIFSMTRFMLLCNVFGFDPRNYFFLVDSNESGQI